jgi:quinol monooxygenase YgiN
VIFIVVKFQVKPEHANDWPAITAEFTDATRAEPGNLFFDWSRNVDDPNLYVLVEAFRDGAAGSEHVNAAHFQKAIAELPAYLVATPQIVNVEVPADDFGPMGEMSVG